MKKHIIFAAISAITLVSCAKIESSVATNESGQEISFTSYIGRSATKATSIDYRGDMKVSAFVKSNQDEYFANKLFAYSPSRAAYLSNPAIYWPLNPSNAASIPMDFYAVSSASGSYSITATTASTTNDTKTIVVGTSAPVSGTDDIVAGTLLNKTRESTDMVLNLSHKLTRVSFKARGADANLKYVITGVTMKALSTGTYTFGTNAWTDVATSKSDYSYQLADTTNGVSLEYGESTYSSLSVAGSGLMLLPGQSSAEGTVTATITYKAYEQNLAGNDVEVYSGSKSIDLSASASADWGVNKSIVYKFTLPAGGTDIQFSGEVNDWAEQTIIANPVPKDALPGIFSVSATRKVYFSKGNLQATRDPNGPIVANGDGNSRWRFGFAEHQYDIIGMANLVSGNLGSTIDLFGWSGDGESAHLYGITLSINASAFSGNFKDWGTAIDNKGTWTTLSLSNWIYLCSRKLNINGAEQFCYGYAKVNGVSGFVLLPDNWDGTACSGFTYGNCNYTDNIINASTWSAMESAGAVFLPGEYYRSSVMYSLNFSYYWSSDIGYNNQKGAFAVMGGSSPTGSSYLNASMAVYIRLVTTAFQYE